MEPVKPHASLGLQDLEALPSRYAFLAEPCALDSPTAKKIEERIQLSLPGFTVVSLQRFANSKLWKSYVQRRDVISNECLPGRDPNVKLLFHGTKQPEQILGTGLQTNAEGFDPRRSAAGEYGVGSYFATCAAYPVKIHPKRVNPDGTFTLIVAEVACGAVKDLGDAVDRSLRFPPERRPGLLYHSVRGTERRIGPRNGLELAHGEQYVVYDHGQAYPHFVVVLQPPGTLVSFETRLFPGFYFDVFGESEEQHQRLRLVKDKPLPSKDSHWGLLRMASFPPAGDPDVVTLESLRFPGSFFDAYKEREEEYRRIRLVRCSPYSLGNRHLQEPWGLFKVRRFSEPGLVSIESRKFPGYFFDVHGKRGDEYKSLRLVPSRPTAQTPWGVLRLTTH